MMAQAKMSGNMMATCENIWWPNSDAKENVSKPITRARKRCRAKENEPCNARQREVVTNK
jgi:hypothetical protein